MADFSAETHAQAFGHTYGTFCDDFYVNLRLGSHLPMPQDRNTLLHFMEQMQRAYPGLEHFNAIPVSPEMAAGGIGGAVGGVQFEESRRNAAYRWVSLEARRLAAGHVNPASLAEAAKLHELVLKIAPYQLGISPVEVEYLDVLFGFDLEFNGDHDEIVAETMFAGSPLACLVESAGARPLEFSPALTVYLDDDRSVQARLEVLTRNGSIASEGEEIDTDVISVYLTLRRFWRARPQASLEKAYAELLTRGDELLGNHVVPNVLRPISSAIASRS